MLNLTWPHIPACLPPLQTSQLNIWLNIWLSAKHLILYMYFQHPVNNIQHQVNNIQRPVNNTLWHQVSQTLVIIYWYSVYLNSNTSFVLRVPHYFCFFLRVFRLLGVLMDFIDVFSDVLRVCWGVFESPDCWKESKYKTH